MTTPAAAAPRIASDQVRPVTLGGDEPDPFTADEDEML
jgi:hypothetical protein